MFFKTRASLYHHVGFNARWRLHNNLQIKEVSRNNKYIDVDIFKLLKFGLEENEKL